MKEADPRAPAEGAALRQRGDQRVPQPLRKVVEARLRVLAAGSNAPVHTIEAAQPNRHRDGSKQQESDFVRERQHSLAGYLRSSAIIAGMI